MAQRNEELQDPKAHLCLFNLAGPWFPHLHSGGIESVLAHRVVGKVMR